ncbi:HNH endonuclease [Bacillus badius]|uniref:HNH endonuclease n=1 Tax=Bacillus badius TaxID=1455 RepID=UPI001CBBDDF8|nr:HNH endonuclease [Bacillus badius]UAT29480.1 HNH endonuclease [Bacillus badius]
MNDAERKERQIGDALRPKILKRDNYKCVICESQENLEVHHKHAIYLGGKSTEENLITLCSRCHAYAPEESAEANDHYIEMRNVDIYKRMMKSPEINEMVSVAYTEFLKERISEYVALGFISEKQKNKILSYDTRKIF